MSVQGGKPATVFCTRVMNALWTSFLNRSQYAVMKLGSRLLVMHAVGQSPSEGAPHSVTASHFLLMYAKRDSSGTQFVFWILQQHQASTAVPYLCFSALRNPVCFALARKTFWTCLVLVRSVFSTCMPETAAKLAKKTKMVAMITILVWGVGVGGRK